MSRIERIFYINRKILEDGAVTSRQVARRFELSVRQVLRDMEYLRDVLKAPLSYDRNRPGYVYTEPFTLMANADEHLLVCNAIFKSLAQSQGILPIVSDLVDQELDGDIQVSYRALTDKIVFISPVQDWPDSAIFHKVCLAMRQNERLAMRYRNGKGDVRRRHVEPLRLISYSGRWYLLAFDIQRSAIRLFHLSRIEELAVLTGDSMRRRLSDEELARYIGGGYGIFMGEAIVDVTFLVFGWALTVVSTQIWHPDQRTRKVSFRGQEALEVTVPVADMQEILSAVLAFGSDACPVSPLSFVELWRDRVRSMADLAEKIPEYVPSP